MKISLCITNHNQNDLVKKTLDILQYQYQKPEYIFVCSDDKPFSSKAPNVICINNKILKGRYENRNSVIQEFLNTDSDALVFIDGDSYPKEKDFIIKYEDYLEEYDLVFGTKEIYHPDKINQRNTEDPRLNMGVIEQWHNSLNFNEKLDLILTGMVSDCSNFGITKNGLKKLLKFMEEHYDKKEVFDTSICDEYENISFGIDSLYAGLKIYLTNYVTTINITKQKENSNKVKLNHLIMDRVRNLDKSTKIKNRVYTTMIILFGVYIVGIMTGLVTMAMTLG